MAGFFKNNNTQQQFSQRELLESKYKNSTHNLLVVALLTLVNIVLLITQADRYFLFSAYVPYALVNYGMFFCGMYPAEYYGDTTGLLFWDKSFFVVAVVLAALIILLYILCWIFSKKNKVGWMIFALVFFVADTALMLLDTIDFSAAILDIVLHAWVIISLIIGIVNYYKLKKLPAEPAEALVENEEKVDSEMLRMADMGEKFRVIAEADASGYNIVYRRVKRTNELVINGRVYDEYIALIEFAHTLNARVGGHDIVAQFDNSGNVYIIVDGEIVAKKKRIF